MEIIHVIAGILILLSCIEIIKYLFLKRTVKLIMLVLIILILFLCLSYILRDVETFKDSNVIQTGAVIAGELTNFFKEKVGPDYIINSTVKSNKLFKY